MAVVVDVEQVRGDEPARRDDLEEVLAEPAVRHDDEALVARLRTLRERGRREREDVELRPESRNESLPTSSRRASGPTDLARRGGRP